MCHLKRQAIVIQLIHSEFPRRMCQDVKREIEDDNRHIATTYQANYEDDGGHITTIIAIIIEPLLSHSRNHQSYRLMGSDKAILT